MQKKAARQVLPAQRAAHRVEQTAVERLNILGPTVEFLIAPPDEDGSCLLRGTIPPGVVVPLHSHDDFETFIPLTNALEAYSERDGGFAWLRLTPGDIFHVPGGARHAFRNPFAAPAVMLIATTPNIARFFREVAAPFAGRPDTPADEIIPHFLAVSERYGYWNAGPEENAAIGLTLPPV
jgi:quercetin dioxygenase-like cupin family protein